MFILDIPLQKPRWLSRSVFNQVLKTAMDTVGRAWHVKILPTHFTREAMAKYGYRKRPSKYDRHKQRKFGHTDPLRYTDDMMKLLLRRSGARISATARRVTVYLHGGGHANYTRRARELTAFSQKDGDELALVLRDKVAKLLASVTGVEKVTI